MTYFDLHYANAHFNAYGPTDFKTFERNILET